MVNHSNSSRIASSPRGREAGLSLIELMVAMVIGLIAVLVVTQMFAMSESRRRSTSGVSGAQSTGSIVTYSIDRDLRLAGYGFADASALGCTVNAIDNNRSGTKTFTFPLQPVTITTGDSDTLDVLAGSSGMMVSAKQFDGAPSLTTKNIATVSGRGGLLRGDLFVAAGNSLTQCGLFEVTDNTNVNLREIAHATGSYTKEGGGSATARYNPTNAHGMTDTQGQILNLGPAPSLRRYSVTSAGELQVVDLLRDPAAVTTIATNVVAMKAQYRVGTNWTTTSPTSAAAWQTLSGMRVSVLLRSPEYVKPEGGNRVTPNAPDWCCDSSNDRVQFVMKNLDGSTGTASSDDLDWRNYRYRVYENETPLRNMLWKAQP